MTDSGLSKASIPARVRTMVLVRATEMLGTREEAEAWIRRPAIGLDQRAPIELLDTDDGVAAVMIHLARLDRGIYS